jgi:phosphodiesterase/alkaline phosphatase D-like protein
MRVRHTVRFPQVFELRGLHPGVHYDIIVENSEDTANSCEECAYSIPADALPLRFRTFSPPSAVSMQDTTLVVLSCDRYLDDQDDAFWAVLRPDVLPVKPHDAMFHIGDQVYTDTLASLVMNASIAIEFEVESPG